MIIYLPLDIELSITMLFPPPYFVHYISNIFIIVFIVITPTTMSSLVFI